MGDFKISKDKRAAIAAAFKGVIDSAGPREELHKEFEPKVRRFIEAQVKRLSYEELMRYGGDREKYFVDRLSEVARIDDGEFEDHGLAVELAQAYRLTQGASYVMRNVQAARANHGSALVRKWKKRAKRYREQRHHLLGWFYEQLVAGEPFVVMDFKVEPKYSLIRENRGEIEHIRMVKLLNGRGELTTLVQLAAEDLAEPRAFRKWCLKNGNYTFGVGGGAGITELNQLQLDMNSKLFDRTVVEQCEYGWREVKRSPEERGEAANKRVRSGLWFFCDAVCTPAGEWLKPNANGIVEWNGEKFRLGETSYDQQPFGISALPAMRVDQSYSRISFQTSAGTFSGEGKSPEEIVRALFSELYARLVETIGSEVAGFVLGMMCAYAAAPEIFGERNEFPGLWIHGAPGSGKSSLAGWLMEIWGFREMKPLILKGTVSTAVGLNIALSQLSNLPLWGDEFRIGEVALDKQAILHNSFNRGRGVKWSGPGMERRAPRTSFVVSGETTTTDAATRGRFAHVLIAANLRKKNHMEWFQKTASAFSLIGRYLLENRREFAEMQLRVLDSWMEDRSFALPEERQRFVYGVAYTGFLATVNLLESHTADEVGKVKQATIDAAMRGVEDVASDIAVNQFWQDVSTLYQTGEMERNWVRFSKREVAHPPNAPRQGHWQEVMMHLQPDPVISAINRMRAQGRGARGLEKKDLVAQMSSEAYWVKDKSKRRCRFGKGSASIYCWCIRLDSHPLGYQLVSDEEWGIYQDQPEAQKARSGDPRLGELYSLMDLFSDGEGDRMQTVI